MIRRVPLSSSCCFCFRLHQGFVNIIYFDIARLFWGILFALITFTKSDSKPLDYTVYTFVLCSIVIQTFFALSSHNKGIPKNNFHIYKNYMIAKMSYIFLNFFQMTFQDTFSCHIYEDQKNSDKCMSNSLALKIFLGLIWTLVEVYFCYIVYCFYVKTLKGHFGPMGYPPIFPDIYSASQNSLFKQGIMIEVKGRKTKIMTMKDTSNIPVGCLVQEKKCMKTSAIVLKNRDPRDTLFHDLTVGWWGNKIFPKKYKESS